MKILAIDCGSRNAAYYDGNTVETAPRETIINAHVNYGLQPGDWIVIEDAHGGVGRDGFSLSQVLTDEELVVWYKNLADAGVRLKLFPQSRTPYLKKEGDEKTDEVDVRLLWEFAAENQGYGFKKPRLRRGYTPRQLRGHDIKDRLNAILNVARVDLYDSTVEPAEFVREHLDTIYDRLSEASRSILFKHTPSGKRSTAQSGLESTVRRLASLASIFWAADGVPSWKFVKQHILVMSPFHRRGGVLRSNIFWHGQRHYIKSKVGKLPADWRHDKGLVSKFKLARREYQCAIREVYRVLGDVYNAISTEGDGRVIRSVPEA